MLIRRRWIAAPALLLALVGCDASSPSGESQSPPGKDRKVTTTWAGKERTYTVHTPPGHQSGSSSGSDQSLPLVIVMHPYPGNGEEAALLSGFSEKADAEDFLVAYPDGMDGAYNALICCGGEDDVGFILAMVKQLTETENADPKRVYATGISNGGDMAFKLAVELPAGTLAAIAPVSGGYIGDAAAQETYMPKGPVPVITFIGGNDRYADSFEKGIKSWQNRLDCRQEPPAKLNDRNTRTSARCRDGSEVVTYRLPEMGHNRPGATEGSLAGTATGVRATDEIWDFFKNHAAK